MVDVNPVSALGLGNVNVSGIINGIGLLIAGIILICGCGGIFYWWWNNKQYNKKTTDFEIVGTNFVPSYRDRAKTVKLGKGGFQILYLRKAKTWRLAYGSRVGKDTYYFFIMKDGYPYNGMLAADMHTIDSHGGLIPVVTTNPTMRAQYTALEKQIDTLHAQKQGIWEKYGNWILTLTFIIIIGVFAWLSFREVGSFIGKGSALAEQMTKLAEVMNRLAQNMNTACTGGSGLVNPPQA